MQQGEVFQVSVENITAEPVWGAALALAFSRLCAVSMSWFQWYYHHWPVLLTRPWRGQVSFKGCLWGWAWAEFLAATGHNSSCDISLCLNAFHPALHCTLQQNKWCMWTKETWWKWIFLFKSIITNNYYHCFHFTVWIIPPEILFMLLRRYMDVFYGFYQSASFIS